jgi:hypothetical protein
LPAEPPVLLFRTVGEDDAVGLGQLGDLPDPGEQAACVVGAISRPGMVAEVIGISRIGYRRRRILHRGILSED